MQYQECKKSKKKPGCPCKDADRICSERCRCGKKNKGKVANACKNKVSLSPFSDRDSWNSAINLSYKQILGMGRKNLYTIMQDVGEELFATDALTCLLLEPVEILLEPLNMCS